MAIIVLILWLLVALFLILQMATYLGDLSSGNKLFVCFIMILFAPAILIANIVEGILSLVLPEGWNDDSGGDDDFKT